MAHIIPTGQNWAIKLFSLAVAIGLWLFVSAENTSSVLVDFRIDYHHADDMMLMGTPPTLMHATLQGPGATLRSYDLADLQPVVFDLRHAEPGTQRLAVDISSLRPPTGLRAVEVSPAEVEVTLERRVERQVPIRPDFLEGPAVGYEILDVRLTPPRARVVGPASKMQDLESVGTRPIDVAGREEDLTLEVDLRPPLSPMQLLDKRVQVFIEIGEEFIQRSFTGVPVHLEGAAAGALFSPSEVSFTLKGPRRLVEAIDRDQLEAWVQVRDEAGGEGSKVEKTMQLRPPIPERTQVMTPVPKITIESSPARAPAPIRRPRRRP